jgi:hypothetical protein
MSNKYKCKNCNKNSVKSYGLSCSACQKTANEKKPPIEVEPPKINKDGFYGGHAGQPHVHVYGNSAHLKIPKRIDLVQNGVLYDKVNEAYDALDDNLGVGPILRPWVDAALIYLKHSDAIR